MGKKGSWYFEQVLRGVAPGTKFAFQKDSFLFDYTLEYLTFLMEIHSWIGTRMINCFHFIMASKNQHQIEI